MSAAPRLLLEGSPADPLVVVKSSFWSFNAIGLFDGDAACVVDPGIYPEDVSALGAALGERAVTHVVVTHSHHDHIRGWMRFPDAAVAFPAVAARKTPEVQERILAGKRKIDEHLSIEDPGFRYPEPTLVFEDRARFSVGSLDVELRFLPGHSNCTSVAWVPELHTLCSADYLVSPGLPYCRWRAREFEQALDAMREWVEEEDVRRILPSHNDPIVGRDAILAAIETESAYFRALRAVVREGLASGRDDERCVRFAARHMAERRAVDLGKKARQDLDNARRVLAEETDRGE